MSTNKNPGAAATASGTKAHTKQQPSQPTLRPPRRQDARTLARRLAERIDALAPQLLGEPTLHSRNVMRWGAHGSLAVNVAGDRRGRWHSFEEGRGGDALDLVVWKRGSDLRDAMKWARAWLGGAS